MATAAATVSKAAPLLQAGGTLLTAGGLMQQGRAQDKAAQFNAQQLEAQGKAEQASKIQEAKQANREKELLLSRAKAVGASSGGGQDYNLLGDIEEEGAYNELALLWQGEEALKGRRSQAAVSRFEGLNRRRASQFKVGSTLLSGGSSFLQNYG